MLLSRTLVLTGLLSLMPMSAIAGPHHNHNHQTTVSLIVESTDIEAILCDDDDSEEKTATDILKELVREHLRMCDDRPTKQDPLPRNDPPQSP